jgi:hypothetical protein
VASDPDLLDAYRKQCQHFGPWLTLLAWRGQPGVDNDDLLDIAKEIAREEQMSDG